MTLPRLAALSLTLMVSSAAFAPAMAQDLTRTMFNMLGLAEEDKDPIIYRERPPLVVPPRNTLPRPGESAAGRAPNWPNDPDIASRRAAAAAEAKPRSAEEVRYGNARLLTQDELNSGRRASREAATLGPRRNDSEETSRDQMDFIRSGVWRDVKPVQSANDLQPGVDVPRRFLTEPPPGVRVPAGSAPIRATPDRSEEKRFSDRPVDEFLQRRN